MNIIDLVLLVLKDKQIKPLDIHGKCGIITQSSQQASSDVFTRLERSVRNTARTQITHYTTYCTLFPLAPCMGGYV